MGFRLIYFFFVFFFFFFFLSPSFSVSKGEAVDLLCVEAAGILGFKPKAASPLNLVKADDSSCCAIHVKKSGSPILFHPNLAL